MVNLVMTVLAHRKRFTLFRYHRKLPQLFSFEVLHLIYMVYMEAICCIVKYYMDWVRYVEVSSLYLHSTKALYKSQSENISFYIC